MRSLAVRALVLNIAHGRDLANAAELCREMADRRDWPATETGEKMQVCWRYAVVLFLFESSRAALEANDMPTAAKQAGFALQRATDSLAAIAGEQPLLKFIESDEDGDTEIVGDFLHRQPNIVTDIRRSDFFPPATPLTRFQAPHKSCWDDFVKWSEAECPESKSLLLAYGLWLAQQKGQRELLLSKCDAFAAKLDSLKSK
jgi:hypothetical protein